MTCGGCSQKKMKFKKILEEQKIKNEEIEALSPRKRRIKAKRERIKARNLRIAARNARIMKEQN